MLVKAGLGAVFFVCLGLVVITAPMANAEPMMAMVTAAVALVGLLSGAGAIVIKPGANF